MKHPTRMPAATRTLALQGGLTLVELMVAMTISLLILAALVALFTNTSRSNREFARANGMIESGRLAIQVLEADVQHAGYWGTYVAAFDDQTADGVPDDAPTVVPDPCLAYDPATWLPESDYVRSLIGVPVQAYQANDPAIVCADIIDSPQDGTDVLVVRHAENCVPGASPNCPAAVAGELLFQASLCTTDLEPFVLGTGGFTLNKRDCDEDAEQRRFMSTIYYVRNFAEVAGDGVPTLMRSQFVLTGTGELEHQNPAVPLIEGIQGFRVELGIDDLSETGAPVDYTAAVDWVDPDTRTSAANRGDGVPDDDYVHCTIAVPCVVGDLTNVTAVRLYVLARSRDASQGLVDTKTYTLGDTVLGPFNDAFQRHLFVSTIRLPNVSGRRITP
jgi:type IV pilus assembly protein PilW